MSSTKAAFIDVLGHFGVGGAGGGGGSTAILALHKVIAVAYLHIQLAHYHSVLAPSQM